MSKGIPVEYTELADYPLPAGVVTEWIPTVVDPDIAWAEDPRALSYSHQDHYRRAAAHPIDQSRPGEWIGSVFEVQRPLDAEVLRRTLNRWFARHEVFRSQVLIDQNGTTSRRTAPAESVDFQAHQALKATPGHRVYQHLKDYFDASISPTVWPHCIAATVVEPGREDTAFTLIFGADHSVMDAYTQMFAIAELTAIYNAEADGVPDGLPQTGSYLDYCNMEREFCGAVDDEHAAVATWSEFLAEDDGLMPKIALPLAAPGERVNTRLRQSSLSTWVLNGHEVADFDLACKATGNKIAGGVIAALALAQQRLSGVDDFRYIMPMHTRNDLKWAASVGWFVGIMPVGVSLPANSTFIDAIGPASAAMVRHRDVAQVPFPRIAQLLRNFDVPKFVISYVDARFVPGASEWEEQRARVLRSECAAGEELYIWVGRDASGLNFSTRFPSNRVASDSVHRLIAEFRAIVSEVAAQGAALREGSKQHNSLGDRTTRSAELTGS